MQTCHLQHSIVYHITKTPLFVFSPTEEWAEISGATLQPALCGAKEELPRR